VLGDFQHAFAGHVAPAQHILEKRDYVFVLLGTAEAADDKRIIVGILVQLLGCHFRRIATLVKKKRPGSS
jgi:hypothetical protein